MAAAQARAAMTAEQLHGGSTGSGGNRGGSAGLVAQICAARGWLRRFARPLPRRSRRFARPIGGGRANHRMLSVCLCIKTHTFAWAVTQILGRLCRFARQLGGGCADLRDHPRGGRANLRDRPRSSGCATCPRVANRAAVHAESVRSTATYIFPVAPKVYFFRGGILTSIF